MYWALTIGRVFLKCKPSLYCQLQWFSRIWVFFTASSTVKLVLRCADAWVDRKLWCLPSQHPMCLDNMALERLVWDKWCLYIHQDNTDEYDQTGTTDVLRSSHWIVWCQASLVHWVSKTASRDWSSLQVSQRAPCGRLPLEKRMRNGNDESLWLTVALYSELQRSWPNCKSAL